MEPEKEEVEIEEEEEEEDEEALKRLIDETYRKIEDSKKIIARKNEELQIEIEKSKKHEEMILEKKQQISRIEESIRLVNDKLGESYNEKKFSDILKKKGNNVYEECTYDVLQSIKKIERNEDAVNWIKNYEEINGEKILRQEKLKMMKYLGHFFESAEKIFDIDNLTFNNMQHRIEKVFTKANTNQEVPDIKITSTIHIKVFLREYITQEEIERKNIEISNDSPYVYSIAIIEYNFLYEIINKFKIITIKNFACKYFSLQDDMYLLVNENFEIWPYDVYIYDEVFSLNLGKGNVRPHCKFFNLNPHITESLKFILIKKQVMIQLCIDTFDNFKFVENSEATKKSKIIPHVTTKKIGIAEDIKRDKELEKIKKREKKKLTRDVIKEKLLEILKELYPSNSTAREIRSLGSREKEMNVMMVENRADLMNYQINTINTNEQDLPKYKRKKKRDFRVINKPTETQTSRRISTTYNATNKLVIKQDLKEKILREYPEILEEFNMDIENFLEYCDKVIENKRRIVDLIIDEEKEQEAEDLENPNSRLHKACAEMLINNKEQSLIPKRRLLKGQFEQEMEYYAGLLVDFYLKKEEEEKVEYKEIQAVEKLKEQENEESFIDYVEWNENEDEHIQNKHSLYIDYDDRIPWWMRLLEFLFIFLYILFNHLYVSVIPIAKFNFFNTKMLDIFNFEQNCIEILQQVESPSAMNSWLYSCFVPAVEGYVTGSNYNKSIDIQYIEIQFEDYTLEECTDVSSFNISFPDTIPMCQSSQRQYIYEQKKSVFDQFNLNYTDNTALGAMSGFDHLFFSDLRIAEPSMLWFWNIDDINNFINYLNFGKQMQCYYNTSSCVTDFITKSIQTIDDVTNQLLIDVDKKYSIAPDNNNVDLVTLNTKTLYIFVYFSSKVKDMIGVTAFTYVAEPGSFATGCYNLIKSLNIDKNGKFVSSGTDSFEYASLFMIVLMLAVMYFKTVMLNRFSETLNRSFFFIIFLCWIIFEYIFKIYHLMNGTIDFNNIFQVFNYNGKDVWMLYDSNLRILKSISILLISYHCIYVVFTVKDLVVFTIFLKPVFQRFFMVLILFIISLATIATIFSGRYYIEFSNFIISFFTVINFSLGASSQSNTDTSTFTINTTQTRFYFDVANYVVRLIVTNFSLITMFYFYRKMYYFYEDVKKSKQKELKEKMEN